MTKREKHRFVKKIRDLFPILHPDVERPHKSCLYWADTTCKVLTSAGIRTVLQAGSMSWPRINPEQDDGVMNTHLSYVWEPHNHTTIQRLMDGLLPEIHIWCAIPETMEIVDLTTRYHQQQCQDLGMDWLGDPPPDYLWSDQKHWPDRVRYVPDRSATYLAINMLLRQPLGV